MTALWIEYVEDALREVVDVEQGTGDQRACSGLAALPRDPQAMGGGDPVRIRPGVVGHVDIHAPAGCLPDSRLAVDIGLVRTGDALELTAESWPSGAATAIEPIEIEHIEQALLTALN